MQMTLLSSFSSTRTESEVKEGESSGAKEDTMLSDIILVGGLFLTRVALPVLVTLLIGNWIARRIHATD